MQGVLPIVGPQEAPKTQRMLVRETLCEEENQVNQLIASIRCRTMMQNADLHGLRGCTPL